LLLRVTYGTDVNNDFELLSLFNNEEALNIWEVEHFSEEDEGTDEVTIEGNL
jgi:hypothetical protein